MQANTWREFLCTHETWSKLGIKAWASISSLIPPPPPPTLTLKQSHNLPTRPAGPLLIALYNSGVANTRTRPRPAHARKTRPDETRDQQSLHRFLSFFYTKTQFPAFYTTYTFISITNAIFCVRTDRNIHTRVECGQTE